jgi:hypothetical protein
MEQYNISANVTISEEAFMITDELVNLGYFEKPIEAYRMAVSVALANNLTVDKTLKINFSSRWQSASFLKNGDMESLLKLFNIKGNPLIEAEYLAEAGLRFLNEKVKSGLDLSSYFDGTA